MTNPQIALVLLGRQQDRLSRQIKALFGEDFDYPTLKRWRDGWATELPLLHHHPELIPAVDRLLEEMAEGRCPPSAIETARLEIYTYHKACWPRLKTLGINLSGYMNDFGAIDPSLKRRFRRQYEFKKRLTNQQQAEWLESILVPWVDGELTKRRRNASVLMATADGYSKARRVIDAAKRFMKKS